MIGGRAQGAGVWRAVGSHVPGHGLRDEVEGRAVGVGASRAIAVHARHDQIGVDLRQPRFGQAHLVERTGSKIFGQNVGVGQQVFQNGDALGRTQVQLDRALVAIEPSEIPRQPIDDMALLAHGVAARRFDLDDVGAQIAQDHRAERTGQDPRKVYDPHAG